MLKWIDDRSDEITLGCRLLVLAAIVALSALLFGYLASIAPDFARWPVGLLFGIFTGQFACRCFLRILRHDYMGLDRDQSRGVPPSLVGVIEQLIFVVAVGVSLSASDRYVENLGEVLTVMGLWLGAKMLTGWNRDDSIIIRDKPEWERQRWVEMRARGALTALLAGVLSLAIATIGGNIAAKGSVVDAAIFLKKAICQI